MKVTNDMLDPELRRTGRLINAFLPKFSLGTFKFMNFLNRFIKGKCPYALNYEQVNIKRADGSLLRLCVYSPIQPLKDKPGLLWIHGGGYAIGTPEQDGAFIKRFIDAGTSVVAAPDYTLSPYKPYPAALDDCYAALHWLKDNGAKYGMRPDQIFVGGNSAGGGLTAAVSLYSRDKGEINIAFQMPIYPMIDDRETGSNVDNDAPLWNTSANNIAWGLYLKGVGHKGPIPAYAAPARASSFAGLPPTCTYVGNVEPFYDETVTYVQKLKDSGVPVHFNIYQGAFHGFDVVSPKSKVAQQAIGFLMDTYSYAIKNYYAVQPQ